LSSDGQAKEHTSKKKGEKRGCRYLSRGQAGDIYLDFYKQGQGKIKTSKPKSDTIRGEKKWGPNGKAGLPATDLRGDDGRGRGARNKEKFTKFSQVYDGCVMTGTKEVRCSK
jgi:hypothetical protein